MDGIQVVIAPAFDEKGQAKIMLGFHAEHFSQCVNVPYIRHEDSEALAKHIGESIVKASEQIRDELFRRETGTNKPSELIVP